MTPSVHARTAARSVAPLPSIRAAPAAVPFAFSSTPSAYDGDVGHGFIFSYESWTQDTRPPSTATSLAVMKLLSDDARKAATAPTSAGSPMCWSAVIEP